MLQQIALIAKLQSARTYLFDFVRLRLCLCQPSLKQIFHLISCGQLVHLPCRLALDLLLLRDALISLTGALQLSQ